MSSGRRLLWVAAPASALTPTNSACPLLHLPLPSPPSLGPAWAPALALMQVVLACAGRGYRLAPTEPAEPWSLLPLARPQHGMPARCELAASG